MKNCANIYIYIKNSAVYIYVHLVGLSSLANEVITLPMRICKALHI